MSEPRLVGPTAGVGKWQGYRFGKTFGPGYNATPQQNGDSSHRRPIRSACFGRADVRHVQQISSRQCMLDTSLQGHLRKRCAGLSGP